MPTPSLFSNVESYQPVTLTGFVYLEFAWGTALPLLSGRACHTSVTVASLAHPKLAGGSRQTHLFWQACLFTVHAGACPPFSGAQGVPSSLLCVLFSCLFIIQFFIFVFCRAGVSLCSGLCWFIPEVAVWILHAAYLLSCWSASPKQVRSWHLVVQEPSWFLHISWCGEAMCGLGVQGYQSFASSWWYFLPGVSLMTQQDFYFMELMLSASSL
jgi:hypothetical protein